MSTTQHLYNKLQQNRPSVVRMTAFSWMLRLVFFILASACIILGVSLFISETAGEQLLILVKGSGEPTGMSPEDRQITLFLAGVFIILGVLFALVSFLSARLVRRGMYIAELEALIEEELEKQTVKEK